MAGDQAVRTRDARRRGRIIAVAALAALAALAPAACGASGSTPQVTLRAFLADWSRGDWAAMRRVVAGAPAGLVSTNAGAFAALGVTTARFGAGRITHAGGRTSARVVAHYALPEVGAWSVTTTVSLVQRSGRWLVAWSPATIVPSLHAGERLATIRTWPARAPILGAGGASLTTSRSQVSVGIVGARIKDVRAVSADLLAAGATRPEVAGALAQAKSHPGYFDPVFVVSQARFAQLKAQPGPGNVYDVPGTQFELTSAREAITAQLAAHVVGTVGPITAQQLHGLGSPYDAGSVVGQTGLEAAGERRLAGAPSTSIEILNADGATVTTLARFPGRPGHSVSTSIDPVVQRAAESALAGARRTAAMVAIDAATGQILAVVSDPVGDAYDQALEGEYPPGSTFKVLTSTALIEAGLSPRSPASCPTTLTVDGEVFHNAEGDQPIQTLDQGFTESCNTAFIGLATQHLNAADITAAARQYGLERTPEPGLPAFSADVPAPHGATALAATAIGQGGVVFSPLGMATVAAAVDSGVVRAPRLVAGAPDDRLAPTPLPSTVVADLRLMMGHVVASGTAAGTGLPATTHAKTGTAQYESQGQLKLDAWLMGYDGDLAFALVIPDSGGLNGGPLDGPIIARFLDALSGNPLLSNPGSRAAREPRAGGRADPRSAS
jgi:cell division protein FtsI/penicillin-binding protein 2